MVNEDNKVPNEPVEGGLPPPIVAPPALTINQALDFIFQVAVRFTNKNKKDEYWLFLETLTEFYCAQVTLAQAHERKIPLPQGFKMPTLHQLYSKIREILKDEEDLWKDCSEWIKPQTAHPQ